MSWERIHYSAEWTPDNPAPDWWAQFDLSWQIDRDDVMSERKLAAFLGWNRRSAVTLLEEVGAVLGIREPKAGQKRASTRKVAVPEVSQSGKVEGGESLDRGAKVEPEVSQVWAKSEPPRARAFPMPEADSEADPDSEKKEDHVPQEPARPLDPEPPACAPPQAIPTSALESTAKEATNTPLGLFNVGSASTADIPKKPKKAASKPDHSEAVNQIWTCYRGFHPRSGEKPPTADDKLIRSALADWTADQLCMVVRWAHTSDHERATFLRNGGYTGISNLLVASKIGVRLELAEAVGTKGPPLAAVAAPQEDPSALWDAIIRRRATGIRIMPDDIPAHVQAAIRTAGGWNQLGLLNDFTEKQARTAFITAIRNPPINGATRTA